MFNSCKPPGSRIHFDLTKLTVAIVVAAGFVSAALAQQSERPETEQKPSSSELRYSIDVNSHAGAYSYVPGEWGDLHVRLENYDTVQKDVLCTTYFDQHPDLQFARQVSVPGRSRLLISHPILFPGSKQIPDRTVSVRSLVVQESQGTEVLVRNESGQLQHERSLLVTPSRRNTGLIVGADSGDVVQQDVLDLLIAGRVYQGLDNKVAFLADHFLPSDAAALKYLDHLVLAENRLIDDLAALAAVRRWVHAGGRIWIMLDRTDPELLSRMFGDDFQGTVLDHVGLNTVRLDKPPSVFVQHEEPGETTEYEDPVEFSRAVISDMKVWNTVNGWPAAMTSTYGQGRVLITTLGPRGWIKRAPAPVPETRKSKTPPKPTSEFVPLPPMEDLSAWVFGEPESQPLPQEAIEAFAKEYVSYSVPTWSLIIGTMSGFLILLAVAGVWLWRRRTPEHFGWIGALLAVLFGAAFVSIGVVNRYSVPETISSVYFARAVGGADDVWGSGVMAVYRREGNLTPIGSSRGGVLLPDLKTSDGSTVRMVTNDLGSFQWKGFSQPAGLSIYPAEASTSFSERIVARATIDANGVSGRFKGPSPVDANSLIATRQGRIGLKLSADGNFTGAADSVLVPGQYLDTTFLNDVQDRRRRILKSLFENRRWLSTIDRPQLLLWMKDWDHGFQFGDGLQRQGDTLLMVPLELQRPPVGTEMKIPSPFLSFSSCVPPDNSRPAGFWDDDRRDWQERSRPSTTWLSVKIPQTLLPLTPSQADIKAEVSGAMGKFELLGVRNGSVVTLHSVTDPVGALSFVINDPDVLTISRDGELTLGIRAGVELQNEDSSAAPSTGNSASTTGSTGSSVGGAGGQAAENYWKIETLSVQLQARVSESPKKN